MHQEISFGQLIKEHRHVLDLTQAELARRVGCATITLRKIEANSLRPSVQIAERLAMAINIPMDERADFVRLARTSLKDSLTPPSTPTPPPLPEEIGEQDLSGRAVRGYELGERIGHGGFGVVYRAVQPVLEREVAIKIILPEYANHPDFIRRFEAEAQLVARLEHPHIVPLYDYWREPGAAHLVMRLLRGGSLQRILEQGPLPLDFVMQILGQIGQALSAAHRSGVIHRDLKPANILLDEDENAYLADFGIAKNLGNPDPASQTRADALVGSPVYISPEQIRSEPVRPQTDIYCLGALLYQMLCGQLPFRGPTPVDYLMQHLNEPLPSLVEQNPDLPAALEPVIRRAMAKSPSERYPTVSSLLYAFQEVLVDAAIKVDVLPVSSARLDQSVEEIENPYKGLRAFNEADADDFFGREALVQDILGRLGEETDLARFLAVVGPSGSGKSSLVKAGLIPALRRGGLPGSESWFVVDFIPGAHPMEELEAALLRVAANPPDSLLGQLNEGDRGLLRAVRRILPSDETVELVLVIDQFEEVFTLVTEEERRARFLESLVTAVLDPHSQLRVVITLRADFTDWPLQYVDFGELFRQRNEFVLPMTPDELERAIMGPAKRAGLILEPGLANHIIWEVSDQPGTLPLLQHALTELFERREGRRLTLAAYDASGGVLGALGQRAEELYSSLDKGGQELTRQIFLRLITLGEGVSDGSNSPDTRRRVLQSELEALTKPNSNQRSTFKDILDSFGRYRLLTFDRDPATRSPTVEVAHEALLGEWSRLSLWLDTSRNDIRIQRLLNAGAEEWVRSGMDPGFLLRGSRLDQFSGWAEETSILLTREEQALLDASMRARRARQAAEEARLERERLLEHRSRNFLIGLVGVFAIATVVALLLMGFARQQARLATSRELASAAISNLETDPELSTLLGLEALDVAYTQQAAEALHKAVQSSRVLFSLVGHSDGVWGVNFSLDGSRLATVSGGGTLKIWDADSGGLVRTIPYPDELVSNGVFLSFGSTGSHVAIVTADQDGGSVTFRSWDMLTGDALSQYTFPIQLAPWECVTFSPDFRFLAYGREDGTAELWDLQSGKRLLTLTGFEDMVWGVFFSPEGDRLAASTPSGQVIVWDVPGSLTAGEGKALVSFQAQSPETLGPATFNQDGTRLALGFAWGAVEVWDLAGPPTLVHSLPTGIGPVLWLSFSPDGSRLAVATYEGIAIVYDLASGQRLFSLAGHQALVGYVTFSPDGTRLATASDDGTARIWSGLSGGGGELFAFPSPRLTFDLELSPDERMIALGHTIGPAQVLDRETGAVRLTLDGEPGTAVYRVSFSPDGARLATTGEDNTNRIWDVRTGELIRSFTGHGEGQTGFLHTGTIDIAYSPDGRRLATAGTDGVVKVWDAETGDLLLSFTEHAAGLCSLVFSPDGRWIATSSDEQDGTVKVWDSQTGQVLYNIEGFTDRMWGLAFSPDGALLAIGGENGVLEIWDMLTGQKLHAFPSQVDTVMDLRFTPDGRQLVTAGEALRIWDLETYQDVETIGDGPGFMDLSRDGKRIYYSRREGGVYGYLRNFEDVVALARSRLARQLTQDECRQYLHMQACPEDQP